MKKAIVFDIDGTLADNTHRLHYIQEKPQNWKAFFDAMGDDKPIKPVRDLCRLLISALPSEKESDWAVIFCSGRPDSHREQTLKWLEENVARGVDFRLYMRRAGDYRPDDVVKAAIIDQMRAYGFDPYIVFDDRKRVVDMWRSQGITCLQCAEGDF